MSGGSWGYFYFQLEEIAEKLAVEKCPHRKMFAAHLQKCANALRSIEWVDSGDYGAGAEIKDITKCFNTEPVSGVVAEHLMEHQKSVEKMLTLIAADNCSEKANS